MRPLRTQLTRRELALVAAALLLPVPLFAISGLSAPLPSAIERGLGSVVSLEASDERSGTDATGRASENGSNERRSERGSLTIGRRGDGLTAIPRTGTTTAAGGGAAASAGPTDDDGAGPTATEEPEGGGGGGAGSPGDPGSPENPSSPESPSSSPAESSPARSSRDPGVSITVGGQGATNGVSAGTGGVSVDNSADTSGAGGDEPGGVVVDVTNEDGSHTEIRAGVPGTGVLP